MSSEVCQARLHFGKAAWSSRAGGLWSREDVTYDRRSLGEENWGRFMEVARALDPDGKFADVSHLLRS